MFRPRLVISGLSVVALVEFGAELVTFEAKLVMSGPELVVSGPALVMFGPAFVVSGPALVMSRPAFVFRPPPVPEAELLFRAALAVFGPVPVSWVVFGVSVSTTASTVVGCTESGAFVPDVLLKPWAVVSGADGTLPSPPLSVPVPL